MDEKQLDLINSQTDGKSKSKQISTNHKLMFEASISKLEIINNII